MYTKCCSPYQGSYFSYVKKSKNQFFVFLNVFVSYELYVLIACKWNNRTCKLYLNYENGLTLYNDSDTGVHLLWHEPFEKIRSSLDDNDHLLMLDFHGEESVMVRKDWKDFISEIVKFHFLFFVL